MYDLIIVGGGPAGATAGIYAARKKLKTLLITKDFLGQVGLTGKIENWPGDKEVLGIDLIKRFEDHLKEYDLQVEEKEVLEIKKEEDVFKVKVDGEDFSSKAVILATGRKPRKLNIPGEKEFTGKGVVYCTTCDAPLFQGKKVAVVGGGNSGLEASIELTDYSDDVSLFEFSSKLPGDEILQLRAKEKGVKVYSGIQVEKVEGGTFVEAIRCKELVSGEEKKFNVEGVFVQIGSTANTKGVESLVDFDNLKDVKIDLKTLETKTRGFFAAGDVTEVRDKQVVVSTGEGAKAALSAYNYLKK